MNYIARPHVITARDYEGYGVYGQIPTFPGLNLPTGMPSAKEAIASIGGIQVVRSEYEAAVMQLLDQTSLQLDPGVTAHDPMQKGQASVVFGTLGSGWATDYVTNGYAVLVEIASVQSGAPLVMMTNAPGYIVDSASDGGAYAVVSGPAALLEAAAKLKQGGPPSGDVPPSRPSSTSKAAVGSPAWMWPAIIGVSAVAIVGIVMTIK